MIGSICRKNLKESMIQKHWKITNLEEITFLDLKTTGKIDPFDLITTGKIQPLLNCQIIRVFNVFNIMCPSKGRG